MNNVLRQSARFIRRNSSAILTVVGAVGVVATAVSAVKATPKAIQRIEEAKEEKGEDLTKLEVVKVAGPVYIPSIVLGASTIACIFGANALNKRKQAALMSAYALVDSSYKEYKGKVKELYGDEANSKIEQEIANDRLKEVDIPKNSEKELFYDMFSRRFFMSTMEDVQRAEYKVNRDIFTHSGCTLNSFYESLLLDPLESGEDFGWTEGGNLMCYWQGWVDFHHEKAVDDDGLEYTIIHFMQEPRLDYDDY